jgi:hypothetical protein
VAAARHFLITGGSCTARRQRRWWREVDRALRASHRRRSPDSAYADPKPLRPTPSARLLVLPHPQQALETQP